MRSTSQRLLAMSSKTADTVAIWTYRAAIVLGLLGALAGFVAYLWK